MKIYLSEVPSQGELELTFASTDPRQKFLAEQAQELSEEPLPPGIPHTLQVAASRLDGDIVLRGILTSQLAMTCSRCLQPAMLPIKRDFQTIFTHRKMGDDLAISDLDFAPIKGEFIDCRDVVHEQLLLEQPVAPLCRPDCLGLCPSCGANRNDATCSCASINPLNPFQALRKGS